MYVRNILNGWIYLVQENTILNVTVFRHYPSI